MTLKEIAEKTAKINGNKVTPEMVAKTVDMFDTVVDVNKDVNDYNPMELALLSIAMMVMDEEIARIQAEFASRN